MSANAKKSTVLTEESSIMKSDLPPLGTIFTLGDTITEEQRAFLNIWGYLHFRGVVKPDEVTRVLSELVRIEELWLSEGRTKINGVPIFWGRDVDGSRFIQRFPFTSEFSEDIRTLVRSERFEPIRQMIGDDIRVGDAEKDGVVINRYKNVPGSVYPRLGWHTDGLRDLFYGRMPQPMLNVGVHFNEVSRADGGLRLIPGSQNQDFWRMAFAKPYFVWHREDPREICVETQPGDVTIHDGRLWHRVARSQNLGNASLRHSMYVPYLKGPYEPKTDWTPTPGYHHLGRVLRAVRMANPRVWPAHIRSLRR